MAAVTRQPFAPLDGARLQNLTSLKNRQNALPSQPQGKRKASEAVEDIDTENVDPTLFSKRSKGVDNTFFPVKDFVKPSPFTLTKAASVPSFSSSLQSPRNILKPVRPSRRPHRASLELQPTRLNVSLPSTTTAPLSAPAGRSPTRGSKRIGILSRRRTAARVDPPSFGGLSGGGAPFSLDAALKGTIPSYSGRSSSTTPLPDVLGGRDGMKADWFFEIHEDTPEQELTNLMQHGAETLDISSDEESATKARRERDEGRDKENVPPVDDVSQTSGGVRGGQGQDEMVVEKSRVALGEMRAEDFWAEGSDETSVVVVPGDEDGEEMPGPVLAEGATPIVIAEDRTAPVVEEVEAKEVKEEVEVEVSIDVLMGKEDTAKAAVLQPIEGTGESFDLWESGSQQGEAELAVVEVKEDVPVEQQEGEVAVAAC